MPRPLYHHAIALPNLRDVRGGVLVPDAGRSDVDFLPAYRWAEREVGFFPLFLAVGPTVEDVRMTGYGNHWAPPGRRGLLDPDPADRPLVLFSFDHVDGVFTDYLNWHLVLNGGPCGHRIGPRETAMLLRRSWPASRWRREARRRRHGVQLLAPRLDLRSATRAWAPDDATRQAVDELGYGGVRVRRIAFEGR